MRSRISAFAATLTLSAFVPVYAANSAAGSVNVQGVGTISPKFSAGYVVRDQRNARTSQIEVMLSEAAIDPSEMQNAFDPHMIAINLDALRDKNYVLLWVHADGRVGMNATFSRTMTQFLNDTDGGLKAEFTSRTATRIEGRLYSTAPLKTIDGTAYMVDLRFGVDINVPPAGTAIPAGGGDPGKALTAFLAAAQRKNWTAIKAGSSADALTMFDKSYNTPAENADSAAELLKAWIPTQKMKVTGGELRGEVAVLDVEGEIFPGQLGLSRVRMVKTGTAWQFDRAARAGMVR